MFRYLIITETKSNLGMKTEIFQNTQTSSAPVNLCSLFKDMNSQMRMIESFSNEKMKSLETRNKEMETVKENLQKENEKLESLLAAKERDYIRGDSMIWDFKGRRPLPVRDYEISIKGGPKL